MDLHAQTTTPDLTGPAAAGSSEIARQVQILVDRAAIADLAVLYMMAVDDHDIDRVLDCFAPDGTFTRAGATTTGHAELRPFYIGMMDRYVTTLHTPHAHVVSIDGPGAATGVLSGHAELSLGGVLMMAAYRYQDRYSRLGDRWVFASRCLQFMYVTPFTQMGATFADSRRIRWPGLDPAEADIPETFATWESYR